MPSLLTPASGTSVVGRCARMKLFRYCIHNCFGDSNERVIDGELNVICPSREPEKKIFIEHDRTENACTVSTSCCPIQSLRNFSKALYGTTGGTYSARVFRPVMFSKTCSSFFSFGGLKTER